MIGITPGDLLFHLGVVSQKADASVCIQKKHDQKSMGLESFGRSGSSKSSKAPVNHFSRSTGQLLASKGVRISLSSFLSIMISPGGSAYFAGNLTATLPAFLNTRVLSRRVF